MRPDVPSSLGVQYPAYKLGPEKLDQFAQRFYDVNAPGLQKLLQINRSTGIEKRSAIRAYESGFAAQSKAPTITDLDELYRQAGVDLAAQACRKALRASNIHGSQITHTIGVTCTNQGSPGYDLLVDRKLGLSPTVDRMLLHGVGCAGGLSIMRAAAQVATLRKKSARILAFACELCTPNVRHDLAEAESCKDPGNITIAAALFSDSAAAFVLCNEYAILECDYEVKPLLELVEWGNATIPDTLQHMAFYTSIDGFRTALTRNVPEYVKDAILPMFEKLVPSYMAQLGLDSSRVLTTDDFSWALHPGGEAIIDGARDTVGLSDKQLQASREIYRTHGNSSSPTVLVVLDRIRSAEKTRDHVVATSFGPGLAIEMAMLRWCEREDE
ncbi:hypothetical protein QQS21_000277 [Conoideocrella luteorostrata]|uniref:Chalcone synthase n=1 Tax=Conoideocrella luteorostrata TaxID=1105319 RepID=A0AAJ0CZE2_9HYPO|nr:hypothetical protein QQS21_000277 [Conoideocrella luteorostrata]